MDMGVIRGLKPRPGLKPLVALKLGKTWGPLKKKKKM